MTLAGQVVGVAGEVVRSALDLARRDPEAQRIRARAVPARVALGGDRLRLAEIRRVGRRWDRMVRQARRTPEGPGLDALEARLRVYELQVLDLLDPTEADALDHVGEE